MNEGTVIFVTLLPLPWPPPVGTQLFQLRLAQATLTGGVANGGRLRISLERVSAPDLELITQRLVLTGAGMVIFSIRWNMAEIHSRINGNDLTPEASDLGSILNIKTKPKIIIPDSVPLQFHPPQSCSEEEKTLLNTYLDLQNRLRVGSPYDLLKAAGLLRLLLLDSSCLFHRVNREYRIPIRFRVIAGHEPPPIYGLNMHFIAISPLPFPDIKIEELDHCQFLARKLIANDTDRFTVKDVIRLISHTKGGVHFGTPKPGTEQNLANLDSKFSIGDLTLALKSIEEVTKVAIAGLRPLIEEVLTKYQSKP